MLRPLIAIGAPGDKATPKIGAARPFYAADQWADASCVSSHDALIS